MTIQPPASVDLSTIKARQQQSWATGDIPIIARPLVGVAENLCEAVELSPGQKVLDVATFASLLERARERAAVERLSITFLEGDAEHLPFPDAAFDVVLSALGVMFTPNQEQAASELLRVCRPGGKIGLVNWTPDGFFGKMGGVMAAYAPPPAGLKPPALWGTEERVRELFGEEVISIQTKKRYFFHRYRSLQHAMEVTCTYFGPAVTALQALESTARERLSHDILTMFEQANQTSDSTVIVPAEYLEVIAVRR